MMTNRDRIELLLLGVVWGASFLFMRVAAPEFGPVAMVEMRVAIAALFLLAVMALRGGVSSLRGAAAPMTVVGVFGSVLPFVLFAYAALHITAGTAAVLNGSTPLFGALVAYFWLKDQMTLGRALGLAVGFAGVMLLAWDKLAIAGADRWAIVAGLVASLSYGIGINFTKKKLAHVTPLAAATGSQIAATLVLLPFAIATWPTTMPSPGSWLSVIALGVVSTGAAYAVYFRLIARIGPARAVTVTYLMPVFGMLWGAIFLHETITTGMIVACAVTLLGTALASGTIVSRAGRSHEGVEQQGRLVPAPAEAQGKAA